ncbi:MAG: hypothetical protein KJ666_05275 [Bacteroidetes bacterium]|nr:hypothetical protein [Bacteroidota bacterium]
MKPIWYFVGLILVITGLILVGAGIYSLIYPGDEKKVLADLHPNLWWGIFMVIVGLIYWIKNRNVTIE